MGGSHRDEAGFGALDGDEAFDEAERIAARRARLVKKCLVLAGIALIVAVVAGRAAFIVLGILGLVLLKRGFGAFLEPELRRRWIEREVDRQLEHRVAIQRRNIEDAHAREVSDLAAGVAREIRNPIQAAKGLVRRMGEDPGSDENVAHAKVALEELGRVERSISHLLRLAREPSLRFREMDLRRTVEDAADALRERAERAGVRLRLRFDGRLLLRGDPERLLQVAKSLLAHGIDAAAGADAPRVEVSGGLDLAGSEVWLRVRERDGGLPPEHLDRLWSPFQATTEGDEELGLALARKLVEGHGGTLEAHAGPGEGTELLVVLPRHARQEGGG